MERGRLEEASMVLSGIYYLEFSCMHQITGKLNIYSTYIGIGVMEGSARVVSVERQIETHRAKRRVLLHSCFCVDVPFPSGGHLLAVVSYPGRGFSERKMLRRN